MLSIAATLLLAAGAASPAPIAVPAEIAAHYRDYNFVNAFSTARERIEIANQGWAAEDPAGDPRRARIAELMHAIESRIDDVDPGIERRTGPRDRRSEMTFRSDLLRITSCRLDADKGEAWIHLDVLGLDGGASVTLVGLYDTLTRGGRTPSLADMLAAAPGPRVRTQEVHHWTRVDGRWRRDGATVVFVTQ